MSCPIYYFFKLILEILLDSTLDSISKDFELTQTLTKKGLKFHLSNRKVCHVFYFTLVLLPIEQCGVF